MAKMVTRTVVGTQVEAKVINSNTDEISVKTFTLSKKFNDDDANKVSKAISKVLGNDEALVKVVKFAPVETLFGVTVEDFMKMAVELDPETRKPLATSTTVEEVED